MVNNSNSDAKVKAQGHTRPNIDLDALTPLGCVAFLVLICNYDTCSNIMLLIYFLLDTYFMFYIFVPRNFCYR